MENQLVTGVTSGKFDVLRFLRGGTLQELNTVLDNLSIGAGGGTTFTPSAPLSLSGGVLSINLSSYATALALSNALASYTDTTGLTALLASKISTSHEANKLAIADVDHSGFDITAQSLSLKTAQGVTVVITADNGGNLSIGSAGIVTVPYLTPLLANKANSSQVLTDVPSGALFTDTLYTHPSQHSMSMITGLTAALASKQATLTTGAGAFLASNVVSGYDLRWLTNGVPTIGGGIRCLHFKSGFQISETLNIGSGQNQLDITATGVTDAAMKSHISSSVSSSAGSGLNSAGNPTAGTVSFSADTTVLATRALVDPEIAKISKLVASASGVSCGTGTGAGQRVAIFEIPASSTYFYGMGLVEISGNLPGVGIWASTAASVPRQNSSSGVDAHVMINTAGNMGINQLVPTEKLHVNGNALISGSLTASSKSFQIDHPDPLKAGQGMKLRHWVTESDEVGGSLLYRRQVDAIQGNNILEMPEFFKHLASHVMCVASPVRHFGLCWADLDTDDASKVVLGTSKAGLYTVLVTARRKDHCALHMCPKEVEFIPAPPSDAGTQNFPT